MLFQPVFRSKPILPYFNEYRLKINKKTATFRRRYPKVPSPSRTNIVQSYLFYYIAFERIFQSFRRVSIDKTPPS